jgi:hypothetical protein
MFRRLNERIAAHIRKGQGEPRVTAVRPAAEGVVVQLDGPDSEERLIRWSDVRTVAAVTQSAYSHLVVTIFIETAEQVLEIAENTDGWAELAQALPAYLPSALPIEDWYSSAASAKSGDEPRLIYSRR